MEFQDFTNRVTGAVKERLGEGYQVFTKEFKKNNGITLTGLVFLGGASNMSPVAYLEPFYLEVEEGRETFAGAVSDIMEFYRKNKTDNHFDTSTIMEYRSVRRKLQMRLVNTKKNEEFLADVPHRRFLDLSVIYVVSVECGTEGQGSMTVNYRQMEMWGVSEQELFEQAKLNMDVADNMEIISLPQLMFGDVGDKIMKEMGITRDDVVPMYIVRTKECLHGAVAMLNQKIMKKAEAIVGKNFMILPSSIHEVLVLPSSGGEDEADKLKEIVREVNNAQLQLGEILSYHVYRYCAEAGEVQIAA